MKACKIKKALFILLVFQLCLQFFACSKDKDDAFSRIKKAGHISFAMSSEFPPFSFYNEKNELVGFDVDVAREVSKRLGVEARIVVADWKGIIDKLQSKTFDGILGSMTITDERAAVVNFSIPYYYTRSRVIVKKGSPITHPKDLAGKKIGVSEGASFEGDAKSLGAGSISVYQGDEQALIALQRGLVDAVVTDEILTLYLVKRKQLPVEAIGSPLRTDKIAVAFRKGEESVLLRVNSVLKAMHDDGTLRNLSEKIVKNEY